MLGIFRTTFSVRNNTSCSNVRVTKKEVSSEDSFEREEISFIRPREEKTFTSDNVFIIQHYTLACGFLEISTVQNGKKYVFDVFLNPFSIKCETFNADGSVLQNTYSVRDKNRFYLSIFDGKRCVGLNEIERRQQISSCCQASSRIYTAQSNAYFQRRSENLAGSYLRNWGIKIDEDNNTITLAFEGTTSVSDWLINAGIQPINVDFHGLMVHSGFWVAITNIFDSICRELEVMSDNQQILITGHSQGGALAQLMYLKLCMSNELLAAKVLGVYTFAAPMIIFNPTDIALLNSPNISRWREKCVNVINGMDIVGAAPRLRNESVASIVNHTAKRSLFGQFLTVLVDLETILKAKLVDTEFRLHYFPAATVTIVIYPQLNIFRSFPSEEYTRCVDEYFHEGALEIKLAVKEVTDLHSHESYLGYFTQYGIDT